MSQSIYGKHMIRTREWEFIDNSNAHIQHELYNLKDDPKEQKNLILEKPDIIVPFLPKILDNK